LENDAAMDNDLLTLMEEYLPAWVISVSVLILVILFLFKKVRETLTNITIFKIFKRKRLTIGDLNGHQFFIFSDYMEKYKIDRMEFGDDGRTRVFRDYFKIRCQTFQKNTKLLISEDLFNLTTAEIKIKILDTLYSSISNTNKLMIEQCNTEDERFVVNFIIGKFSNHSDSSVEAFKEVIENVFDSTFTYENNIDRLNAILNIFLFVFVSTFAESEKVLHGVNGEITGKNYKGLLIK
jgi:hypothetical protein